MKIILGFIVVWLMLDVLGFIMWGLSGQIPVDGFYLGAITKGLLTLVF